MPLRRLRNSGLLAALLLWSHAASAAAADFRYAPNANAAPVNQLQIAGNACGPAALLASFRTGDANWQHALTRLPTEGGDKEQMLQWIKRYGLQPSVSLQGRKRWTGSGINVDDLVAAANETTRGLYLPVMVQEDLFRSGKEDPAKLLSRVRDHLDRSLAKGIPPVLSLRRYVLRKGSWTSVQGHFVTVTGVAKKAENGAVAITYLDPWGGKRCEGVIRIPTLSLLSQPGQPPACLEAAFPAANVGKANVKKGETTAIVPAALIGRW